MSLSNKQLIILGMVICLFEGAFWTEYFQNRTKLRLKKDLKQKQDPSKKGKNPKLALKKQKKAPLFIIKKEKVKQNTAYVPQKTTPKAKKQKKQKEHTIRHGDKLWTLAKNFYSGKTNREILKGVMAIKRANKWLENENKLPIGRSLIIPNKKEIEAIKKTCKPISPGKGSILPTVHQLVLGETLYQLAYYYYSDEKKWLDILSANPHLDPTNIRAGTKLTIPLCQGQDR